MSTRFTDLLRDWDGLSVVIRFDKPTGAWIFIALHDATLGAPAGGTRLKIYDRPEDGLLDAQRLAEGMTCKWTLAGVDRGGGKAVLALERPLEGAERVGLLKRYGALIERLNGAFGTGQDLGTTTDDMAVIGSVTRYVHGIRRDGSGTHASDPGPYTARGVYRAILAVFERLFGEGSVAGRTILISGVGSVGTPLAHRLAADGASLVLADLDPRRAEDVAGELGARAIALADVETTPCDLYAPCAIGAVLNPQTIPRLACKAIAGSANNQLASDADGEALAARGILYAPDFVANAGGAIAFVGLTDGATEAEVFGRVDRIEQTLGTIFEQSQTESISPLAAALSRVRQLLETARAAERT